MCISDWSSDVCSSDLFAARAPYGNADRGLYPRHPRKRRNTPNPGTGNLCPDRTCNGGKYTVAGRHHAERNRADSQHGHTSVLRALCRTLRSEELRVWRWCVSTVRSRWSTSYSKKNNTTHTDHTYKTITKT